MKPLFLLLVSFVVAGCTSRYAGYRYTPQADSIVLQESEGAEPLGRALVRCLGIDDADGRPEVVFRLRLENDSDDALELGLDEVLLLDLAFREFGRPRVMVGPPRVEPHAAETIDLAFPFPGGDRPDLGGLILRWNVKHRARVFHLTSNFERLVVERLDRWSDPYYPYYGWRYPWRVGFGARFVYYD